MNADCPARTPLRRALAAGALVVVLTGCAPAAAPPQGLAATDTTAPYVSRVSLDDPGPRLPESVLAAAPEEPGGWQMSYLDTTTGIVTANSTGDQPRPALSLAKLYIADYVIDHGTHDDIRLATLMIRTSDDDIAERLWERYPTAIDDTATRYRLTATQSRNKWGYSVTSTNDLVRFVGILLRDKPNSPILSAMRHPTSYAADGYPQDWGTSVLDRVEGTKWGWAYLRPLHASISFGDGFVVAASTHGTADDLTGLVEVVTPQLVYRSLVSRLTEKH